MTKTVPKKETLTKILERQFSSCVPNKPLTVPEWIAITQGFREWLMQIHKEHDYYSEYDPSLLEIVEMLDNECS